MGVITVIFFLFTILPGDPAKMMLGQNQTSEQVEAVKRKYGFDKPLGTQYLYYLNDLSPLSFHSKDSADYTFLNPNKYNAKSLFSLGTTSVAVKTPYLRESFTKQGKSVTAVIGENASKYICACRISHYYRHFYGYYPRDSFCT
jgi:peptide/nickel transport system permease protein